MGAVVLAIFILLATAYLVVFWYSEAFPPWMVLIIGVLLSGLILLSHFFGW